MDARDTAPAGSESPVDQSSPVTGCLRVDFFVCPALGSDEKNSLAAALSVLRVGTSHCDVNPDAKTINGDERPRRTSKAIEKSSPLSEHALLQQCSAASTSDATCGGTIGPVTPGAIPGGSPSSRRHSEASRRGGGTGGERRDGSGGGHGAVERVHAGKDISRLRG